jgi:protocatechuate 3,4-dioxygenase beta subunit
MQLCNIRDAYLSRRGFLGGMAVTAFSALSATPACTLTSEQEEGPYYIDDETLRRDITEGRPGVPLILAIRVVDARSCAPLRDAALDIWHCDAAGVYSGFTADNPDGGRGRGRGGMPPGPPPAFRGGDGFGRGPGGPRSRQIEVTRFLRGVQISDDRGLTEFSTLYPGWYADRAIHIHTKVHIAGESAQKYSGGHVAHTGQLFFPEDLTERIARIEPYAKRQGVYRTTQAEDGIFNSQHGAEGMLKMEKLGKSDSDGFRAVITLAIDPEATPSPVGIGGRGPAGPPPRG